MSDKQIEAVIEIQPFEGEPPWAVSAAAADWSYLSLSAGLTFEEIGSVMLAACEYNHHVEVQPSAIDTLKAFVADDFVLPGGLQFLENEELKVYPGCCCGLEDWRDWFEVPNGRSIWAGHDPTPEMEFTGGIIRIWQDKKAAGVSFIDFEAGEMRDLLAKVETDLKGFLFRVGQWADFNARPYENSWSSISPAICAFEKMKKIRIYADFNGLRVSPRNGERWAVGLDTFGTVWDLSNAGIKLQEDTSLIIFDWSDESEDLEGHCQVYYDGRRKIWWAELDEQGVMDVPRDAGKPVDEFLCLGCRKDLALTDCLSNEGPLENLRAAIIAGLDESEHIYGRQTLQQKRCPWCETAIIEAVAPPENLAKSVVVQFL